MNVQMCTTISRINVSYCPRHTPPPTTPPSAPLALGQLVPAGLHTHRSSAASQVSGAKRQRNRVEDACAHSPWHSAQASCGKLLSLSTHTHTRTVTHTHTLAKYLVSQVAAASIDCACCHSSLQHALCTFYNFLFIHFHTHTHARTQYSIELCAHFGIYSVLLLRASSVDDIWVSSSNSFTCVCNAISTENTARNL